MNLLPILVGTNELMNGTNGNEPTVCGSNLYLSDSNQVRFYL